MANSCPYPSPDHFVVQELARHLDGLAFGSDTWYLNFRTSNQYYAPLAQAFLNAQAGWFFDIEKRVWRLHADIPESQRSIL